MKAYEKQLEKKLADVLDTETDMDREREFFFIYRFWKLVSKGMFF